ncbi:DNA mismatch repair protein MutS [Candidatus Gracilibacteria bacterium]|nr:DNA mismatch repair protein MutS [Candidatus Gracilibacteria bacterium]
MENILKIIDLLEKSIKDDPSDTLTAGEIIKDGYDKKVDEYRQTIENANTWLADYQAKISSENNISNLKIKYTGISGYFIEIPKSQVDKIPDYFIFKQSLVGASRYVTLELKEFEQRFLEAQNSKASREYELFLEIRAEILENFSDIKNISDTTTNIDFLSTLSQVAYDNNYTKPEITSSYDLEIVAGRHPVIEKGISDFISNDLFLDKNHFVHIITGPNMGGKSTFLRQNALIILMAHIGSFVPAKFAKIPLTDKIFSRVGASDNLFLGQSTFMVEMQEVANILNNSTNHSFVIIDEVGRGTSTYDGMSLAWAILRENHDHIKAKTLFATHYHELIDESKILKGAKNFSVAVGENDENLVFLRKVISGGIKKSFGLEVARIAGIGESTLKEAREMLKNLEQKHNKPFATQLFADEPKIEYIEKESEVENILKNIDVNNLTPIEALNKIFEMKKKI